MSVPAAFDLAIVAARVVYIRAGRVKLMEHNAIKGIKAGGHTIAKHVAIPENELLARLARNPQMQSVSSYYACQMAEQAISLALKAKRLKIIYWAKWAKKTGPLERVYRSKTAMGYGFRQGSSIKETCSSVRVVLLKKFYNGKPYYVLTSYPWMG